MKITVLYLTRDGFFRASKPAGTEKEHETPLRGKLRILMWQSVIKITPRFRGVKNCVAADDYSTIALASRAIISSSFVAMT